MVTKAKHEPWVWSQDFASEDAPDSLHDYKAGLVEFMKEIAIELGVGRMSVNTSSWYHDYACFGYVGAGFGHDDGQKAVVVKMISEYMRRVKWYNVRVTYWNGNPNNRNVWSMHVTMYRRQYLTATG